MFEVHQRGFRFTPEIFGEQYEYPVSAHAPAAGIKRLVFENPRGNIRVTGGDAQEVTINGRKLIRSYSRSEADRTQAGTPLELADANGRPVHSSVEVAGTYRPDSARATASG